MKKSRRLTAWVYAVLISICTSALLYAEQPVQPKKTVNAAAAARALEHAVILLGEENWDQASFEARLGLTYDPLVADFSYIEALSLSGKGAPRADILECLDRSLTDGLFWRSYDRREAVRLCALLYAETLRYQDALSLIEEDDGEMTADADYVRLLCLYGLGRRDQAVALVRQSLERWPFDSRFPEVFFLREAGKQPDEKVRTVADSILSRLYIWQDDHPELLLLSVPFERSPDARERAIRVFRNMNTGSGESLYAINSAVLALEYGLITEDLALSEILSRKYVGIPREAVFTLLPLLVNKPVRESFIRTMSSFDGVLVDDRNTDGIIDSRVSYRMGRPVQAAFDTRQTGYPDITLQAELGDPAIITLGADGAEVIYDVYPAVNRVLRENKTYTMRPQKLIWAPVRWIRYDGFPHEFFFLVPDTDTPPLTERMLIASSLYYTETVNDGSGGERRYVLENSVPVMSEQRINGTLYSRTVYHAGKPASALRDSDTDGYFETRITYHDDGSISIIEMDKNANRTFEYAEFYEANGTIRKKWDSDEDGVSEIEWEKDVQGTERTRWLHPVTGKPVETVVEKGIPRTVRYGTVFRPVLSDEQNGIQWIGRIPPDPVSTAKKIHSCLNRTPGEIVCPMMEINTRHFAVVKTGGFIFVELLDETR